MCIIVKSSVGGRCVCDDIFKKRGSAATHVRCKMSSILALDRFDRGYKWVLYRRTFPLGLGCGALPSILERTKSRWLGSSGGRVGFCYLPCSRTVASSHGCRRARLEHTLLLHQKAWLHIACRAQRQRCSNQGGVPG